MTSTTDDFDDALQAEYAAVFAWGLIGAQTSEDRRALARTALGRHEAARTWLRQQYVDAGQTAPAAASAYTTGRVTTPEQAAALAVQVELACVPAWSKVAASGDAAQRAYAAAQAQSDAVRAMAWGAGTSAFPGTSGGSAADTAAGTEQSSAAPTADQSASAAPTGAAPESSSGDVPAGESTADAPAAGDAPSGAGG